MNPTMHTSIGAQPAMPVIDESLCSDCLACAKICPTATLIAVDGKVRVDPNAEIGCFGCGHCMAACKTGAVQVTGRKMLPEHAHAWPTPRPAEAGYDDLLTLMLGRRSVRRFKNKPIEREVLDKVIRATSTAPMGFPPSDVSILTLHGRDTIRALTGDLMAMFQKMLKPPAPLVIAIMKLFMKKTMRQQFNTFLMPAMKIFVRDWADGKDHLHWDPHALMIFHQSPYADPADGTIAATYAMLAAQSLGLSSVMLAYSPNFLKRNKTLMKKWGIPTENDIPLMLALGYPAVTFHQYLDREMADATVLDAPPA